MSIFGIADLHLALGLPAGEKTMDVFSEVWQDHHLQLAACWQHSIGVDDLVIVAGDISWAMTPGQAQADLDFLASLPGQMLLLKGNHDYWWHSIGQVRRQLPPRMYALQNDAFVFADVGIIGTRGWSFAEGEAERKIWRREVLRFGLSLAQLPESVEKRLAVFHFPPVDEWHRENELIALMQKHGVQTCIYGHLHGQDQEKALIGKKWGIDFSLISADSLAFCPKKIYNSDTSKCDKSGYN